MKSRRRSRPDREGLFPGASAAARRMRALDWDATPLGAPERWPVALRGAVGLCLGARDPALVAWGPELRVLANDAALPYVPDARSDGGPLARPARECWAAHWDALGPLLDGVVMGGASARSDDLRLPFERASGPADAVVRIAADPIFADDGRSVSGVFVRIVDASERAEALAARDRARTLFARFMRHLPGLAWIKDADGRYVYANRAAEEAFRTPRDELYGRTDAEIFPPEVAAQFAENDRLARASESGVLVTEQLEHGDGVVHRSIVSKFPIPDVDAQLLLGGMAIDVTERWQAEEAWRQGEERLRLALTAAQMAAWEWRPVEDGLVMSDNAAEVFGFPPAAALALGAQAIELVHPDDVDPLRESVLKAIAESGTFLARIRIVRPDTGEVRWMEPHGQVVRDDDGGLRLFGVVTDVSERERVEGLLGTQRHVLELVARGAPLERCLEDLCRGVERIDGRARACVALADPERTRFTHAVAPGLPKLAATLRDLPQADGEACARALHGGDALGCGDLARDERWPEAWRSLLLAHGVRAGCAAPIAEDEGPATGVVLLCFDAPRAPGDGELRLCEMARNVAGIALRRDRAEQALRVSEERYRSLSQALTSVVWTTDAEGRFVAPQPGWAAYTGQSEPELWDFGWADALHPDDRPAVLAAWEAARDAGAPYASAGRLFHAASGAYRHFEARGVPIRDADGRVREWVGTCIDVEERERAERALRESEQHFRTIANTAPAVLWITDPEGACSFLSRGWFEYTGQNEEEALGSGWFDAVHADDRKAAAETFEAARERQVPFTLDCRLRRADGAYRWIIGAGRPRFARDGAFEGYVGTVIDVHERKQAEEALREADRRKDEFLATLAHELRNPLAPLLNSLQLMKLAPGDAASVAQAHATMERQIRQMVRLIDDLLDVSRISRGLVELRRERVELARVVDLGLETVRPLIERAGHRLEVALADEPLHVDADVTRLGQVFSNLLNNAAKFTEKGGRVWLAVERRGGEAVVSVRDSGCGIPREMLGRVFELFTQVDRSLEKTRGGLGIGLTLVQRLVELHGGRVEARSDGPGGGSEFVVRLPLAADTSAESTREGGEAAPRAAASRRVLVVDDSADHATSLAWLLRALGHETRTAADGVEALEVAESFQPDVVLLDIGMPRLNGYETARRIRERPWGERARLVAVSGWGQAEDRRRSREAGFDAHLVKPVEPSVIERLLADER